MSVYKNVPEIRFKGFSGEWIENYLGGLIDIRSAARVHKEQWTEAGVPFFRTSDVVSIYKGAKNTKAYISQEVYQGLSEKIGKVTKDDLLITGGGSIGIPYLVPNDDPLYFKDADLLWLKNNKKFDGYFLYAFLLSQPFRQYIKSISHTGTIAHYTIEQAKSTPINTCDNEEQTAIGNYFQKIDNLINQHQQKHDKLSNIKQAMLEKMFPKQGETIPEIRFKGFSGEWSEKELNSEVELFSGLTYSPKDIRKEGTFVIRSSNVKNGQLVQADNVYVDPEVVNCSNVKKGDVIVVVRNGSRSLIGKHAQVTSGMKNTVIGAFMTGIRSKQPGFINALFDTSQFTAEVEKNLGATINQITNGAFNNMVFMFPGDDEQAAIGNYFQKLDTLINQHQQQITKLNNIKQACLSKMFV
ncbi:restriction endonuclease subunit S [Microbulbifer hainanensis]|uniref:restriction endonuclease subunit S n=1 Tax=Microbulbifer hainanensis TaxID=2735675 RepID=UPI001866F667|nr:restriction endonuclease subunit S [Microbulbifer hainanensis]